MINLNKEKGSVSILVIVTIFFLLAMLTTAYISNTVQRKAQLKAQISLKDTYEKDVNINSINDIIQDLDQSSNDEILRMAKQDSMFDKTENTKIDLSDGTLYIPAGYKVTNDSGSLVDEGIVITDENGNEWVWVPVADVSALYEQSQNPIALSGSTGVTTSKYTKSRIANTMTRGTPGSQSMREPDILVNYDDNTNAATAGFTSLSNMAQTMVDEYNQMIVSIAEYGGFYIARYELSGTTSNPKVQRGTNGVTNDLPITNKSWYELYKACKKVAEDKSTVISRMVWGCQWDIICNYVSTGINAKSKTDSSTWGNYSNYNTARGLTSGDEGYEAGAGSKQVTGSSENWKAKNIYDLAGNCYECTQESFSVNSRIQTGGYYGSDDPEDSYVMCLSNFNPTSTTSSARRYSPNININANKWAKCY